MTPSTLTPAAALDRRLGREAGRSRTTTAAVQVQVLHLFDACAPELRRYARTCGLASDAAEDVVQEAFLALFDHLRRDGDAQNLKGWLVVVCYRLALKQRQRLGRRHHREMTLDGPFPEVVDRAPDAESAIATRQLRRRVRAVMRALPERDRQCLSMRAEGVTYRHIAAALGISLGAVAKAVARAAVRVANAVKA
jgi:RNA polymerase sigma-70 factor (ECF subfamily)